MEGDELSGEGRSESDMLLQEGLAVDSIARDVVV